MTCTVVDCEQRSAAWFAARAGKLTATGAAAMLSRAKKAGDETAGRVELRVRLALESIQGVPLEDERFENEYMRRGREREADARRAYEAMTGEIVLEVGFLQHDSLPIGCSPDGVVGDGEGGLELKCPKYTTHYGYLQRGVLPNEYVPQITHSLFVTGWPWWDFCSYCPEFTGAARLFRVRVDRDPVALDAYALAVALFLNEIEIEKRLIRELSLAPEPLHA